MAHFYGEIQGNRGCATRMGTKNSGMMGHIRGWNVGARVFMDYNEDTGEDECTVSITSGSNGHSESRELGTFTAADLDKTPVQEKMIAQTIRHERAMQKSWRSGPPIVNITPDEVTEVMRATGNLDAEDFIALFTAKDPQFDRERFLAACGID